MVEQEPVAAFGGEDIKQEEPSSQTLSANDDEEMAPATVAEEVPNPSEKASNFQNTDLQLDEPMEAKTEEKVCKHAVEDQPDIIHETI